MNTVLDNIIRLFIAVNKRTLWTIRMDAHVSVMYVELPYTYGTASIAYMPSNVVFISAGYHLIVH